MLYCVLRFGMFPILIVMGLCLSAGEAVAISRDQLRELGYDVYRAERQYPRIRSISYEKALALLEHLESDWKFSRRFLVKYPSLLGHYLPELKSFFSSLPPEERADLLRLHPVERIQFVKLVRAKAFQLPDRFGRSSIQKLERRGCDDWLSLLAFIQ